MPNRLILEVGNAVLSVPLKGTNQQIRAAVRRFALSQGMDITGMAEAQVGEAALRRLLRLVKSASSDRQKQELLQAQLGQIENTVASDNDLYDEA